MRENRHPIAYSESFDSWAGYVDVCENGGSRVGASHEISYGNWSGTNSWEEAIDYARNGWGGMVNQIDSMVSEFTSHFDTAVKSAMRPRYDFYGGSVDVGRAMTGEPECMVNFRRRPKAKVGRVIHIGVNGGALAEVDPELYLLRGAAVVALLQILQNMNITVKITMEFNPLYFGKGIYHSDVVLKHETEAWNIGLLAFQIANPSTLRRINFAWREKVLGSHGGGYGASQDFLTGEYDIAIGKADAHSGPGSTKESAIEWLRGLITGLGILNLN